MRVDPGHITDKTMRRTPRPGRTLWIVAGTLLVALPRFGNTTPDSQFYVALTRYFEGTLAREELQTPYAFRWLLPWLASWLPGNAPYTALALCSLLATLLACLLFARLLERLVPGPAPQRAGLLLLIVSFPIFNYGAAVLTDSAGFLVLTAAACALVERRFLPLGLVLAAGVCIRETTLLMLPVTGMFLLLKRDGRGLVWMIFISAGTLAAAWMARMAFADLPPYYWAPDGSRFTANIARPVSWATLLCTLLPVGVAAAFGLQNWRGLPRETRHFLVATAIPTGGLLAFSMAAAFMSGRFAWPLYLTLIPLASHGLTATTPVHGDLRTGQVTRRPRNEG